MPSTTLSPGSPALVRPARILIVDDSAVMRAVLRRAITSDKRIEVVATAANGAFALRILESFRPDLVLLDVEMPVMDGLCTLKQMRATGWLTPVIMCSSLTHRGARVTIEALASGASDYVAKPLGHSSREAGAEALAQDLIPRILALTGATSAQNNFEPAHPSLLPHANYLSDAAISVPRQHQPASFASPVVLMIGVSTGGPAALEVVLSALPSKFPLPVLIVQHMPELFTKMLAERLNDRCALRVSEAVTGEPVQPGRVYIAKGNRHMEVFSKERYVPGASPAVVLRLTEDPPENHCRPAVDALFRSGISVYGSGVLAVVLTGMGFDGLAGARMVREHGGAVLAQDQATSAVWGMPGAVVHAGLAHRILPLPAIVPEILRLVTRKQCDAFELRESMV